MKRKKEQRKVYYAVPQIFATNILRKTGIVATTYNPLYVFLYENIALERFKQDEPFTKEIAIIPLVVDMDLIKIQCNDITVTTENGIDTVHRVFYGVIYNLCCDLPDESEIKIYRNMRKRTFER